MEYSPSTIRLTSFLADAQLNLGPLVRAKECRMLKRTTWKLWITCSKSILSFRRKLLTVLRWFYFRMRQSKDFYPHGQHFIITSQIATESFYKMPLWSGAAALENVWQFLKKLDIKLPHDPEIPLLGIFPGEIKHVFTQKVVHIVCEHHLFILAKKWNQYKWPSADGWINKM